MGKAQRGRGKRERERECLTCWGYLPSQLNWTALFWGQVAATWLTSVAQTSLTDSALIKLVVLVAVAVAAPVVSACRKGKCVLICPKKKTEAEAEIQCGQLQHWPGPVLITG